MLQGFRTLVVQWILSVRRDWAAKLFAPLLVMADQMGWLASQRVMPTENIPGRHGYQKS
jgi:hypothetical protein